MAFFNRGNKPDPDLPLTRDQAKQFRKDVLQVYRELGYEARIEGGTAYAKGFQQDLSFIARGVNTWPDRPQIDVVRELLGTLVKGYEVVVGARKEQPEAIYIPLDPTEIPAPGTPWYSRYFFPFLMPEESIKRYGSHRIGGFAPGIGVVYAYRNDEDNLSALADSDLGDYYGHPDDLIVEARENLEELLDVGDADHQISTIGSTSVSTSKSGTPYLASFTQNMPQLLEQAGLDQEPGATILFAIPTNFDAAFASLAEESDRAAVIDHLAAWAAEHYGAMPNGLSDKVFEWHPDGVREATSGTSAPSQPATAGRPTLHDQVREVLAEMGVPAVVTDDEVVTDSGSLGLDNLARKVNNHPGDPKGVIRNHLSAVLGTLQAPPSGRGPDDVILRIYDEAITRADLPERVLARPWAPGLVLTLAHDLPDAVTTVTAPDPQRWGRSPDELFEIGRRNLLAHLADAGTPVQTGPDGNISAFDSESMFTASQVLNMPELCSRIRPGIDVSHGVLFAVPFRHVAMVHVIDGPGEGWVLALQSLASLAPQLNSTQPGPVSPSAYLWRDGEVTRVSELNGKQVVVTPGPYLTSLLH